MKEIKDIVVDLLKAKDASRSRSQQTAVGPSELGGCARKVWYRLNQQPETNNNELKLAAIMGTAIHGTIEEAIRLADPKGEEYLVEQEVEAFGIQAHVDLYVKSTGAVVDWKSVKSKNLNYFPSKQQRWQVQVYGLLLNEAGFGVNTVNLVAIPRDGDERDIKVHSEPFDKSVAEEALEWLQAIKNSAEAPAPGKDSSYCQFYCKYYDASGELGCIGLKKGGITPAEILLDDPTLDSNALEYLQINNELKKLEAKSDELKSSLEGVFGRTLSGVEINWTTVAPRQTIDEAEVLSKLGFVPKKTSGKETARLSIKHTEVK
jgi:CRISPR/Cas system-associated exonuclease Cas4 (RecB family)